MDPELAQPSMIETMHAVLVAAVALVTGIGGTVLAFLKLGVKSSDGRQGAEIKALPVPEGWKEVRTRVRELSSNHGEHDRLVRELHAALLDPEREVQRRLMKTQLDDIQESQKQTRQDIESLARSSSNNAEAVDIVARKLKELSQ
tara:strand:+ start:796 stop:1230 length:435 start_codon:yes stop_codon:yes gene_type:complete